MRAASFGLVVIGALAASSASAWDGRDVSITNLSATTNAMAVLTTTADPRILVVGPARTWLVHPRSGEVLATVAVGGVEAADGTAGWAFVCGEAGLQRLAVTDSTLGEPVLVDPEPCRAVGRVAADKGPLLVAVSERVRTWPINEDGSLGQVYVIEGQVDGVPLVGIDKRRFAVAARGGTQILEEGPWGTSSLATGGPIGGLAAGPSSWVWSHPDEDVLVDVTRARIPVADHPAALAAGDLDGDGARDIIVAHPRQANLGVVLAITGAEALIDAPVGVHSLRVADVDGDGCDEIVALTAMGSMQVVEGTCGSTPALAAAAGDVRGFDGVNNELVIGDTWPTVQVPVAERVDLQLVDSLGAATAWAASGGPPGLVVTSSGALLYQGRLEDVGRWRVSVRMWVNGSWARKGGFELVVRPALSPQVSGAATPARVSTADDLTVLLDEDVGTLKRTLAVRGCALGFGGVVGGSQVRSSWVLLGETFVASASPLVNFSCDGGRERGIWWSAGVEAAPWFVYVVEDFEFRHGLTTTVALGWTNQELSVGGYGAAGATVIGLGPIARYQPFETNSGARHGPEARFLWIPSNAFIFEAAVLYTVQTGRHR